MSEQVKVKVDVKEHCDGHAGADGPHYDAKEETGRGDDDAQCSHFYLYCVQHSSLFSLFYLSFTLKHSKALKQSFMCHLCFEAKQRSRCIVMRDLKR